MSIELRELIDKEELILDTKRLSDWKRNAGKQELIEKIDELKHKFIEENCIDWETMTLICKLVEEIKDII